MNCQRTWIKRLRDADAPAWRKLYSLLRDRNLNLQEDKVNEGSSGIVLLPPVDPDVLEKVSIQVRESKGPVLAIVLRRSDLGTNGSWGLMQAGVSDVFAMDECASPADAIAARLQRIAEVEELVDSPVVKENLIGTSRVWRQVIRNAVEVARFSDGSLLITGESGTGKDLVARLVHTLDIRPDKGKLVVLDCTTVAPELSGSEFFGHERGAFTNAVAARDGAFALAHRGSLFLDEVGELPLRLQAELLRVVQERTYKRVGSNIWKEADFRLVCATNRNLQAEQANGNFRLDFLYRIASSHCHLPPLRERREDILPLARHFLRQAFRGRNDVDFAVDVQDMLLTRDYPGNIRELRQLVLRISRKHSGSGPITVGSVPEEDRAATISLLQSDWRDESFQNSIRRALASGVGLQEIREQTVEMVIQIALSDAVGNIQRAAVKLGVTDRALQMRCAARRGEAQSGESRRSNFPSEPSTDPGTRARP